MNEPQKPQSLNRKLALACLMMAVMICVGIATSGYFQYREAIYQTYNHFAYQIAHTARSHVDGNSIARYLETKETDESYERMSRSLYQIYHNTEISSIYIAVPVAGELAIANVYDVRSVEAENKAPFAIGVVDPIANENPQHVVDVYETGEPSDDYFIRKTKFGYNTAAIIAVKNDAGVPQAILVVDVPIRAIEQNLNQYLAVTIGLTIVIVSAFLAILQRYLRREVVRPLRLIAAEADGFIHAPDTLSTALATVDTRDEIETLARSIYRMEENIIDYVANLAAVTAEKERIGAELGVATQIQASMLPCIFPAFPERSEFDIYATMTPAKEVGGDFYDFFLVDDDHLAMVMADVSGKGVPAALFMVIAKTLLKNSAQAGLSPKAVLERVNNQLCENNEAEMFVTVWLGILEISTGKLRCANGGHEYPALRHADGAFSLYQDKHGFVLGGMEGMRYPEYDLLLLPGDRLFLYTDGVPEATNGENVLFDTDRMLASLNRHRLESPVEQLLGMKADIDAFVGTAPQFDDITMIAFDYLPPLSEEPPRRLRLPPAAEAMAEVMAFVEGYFEEKGIPLPTSTQLSIAVDEIFSNITQYSGATEVEVLCGESKGRILLRFSDNGTPYNPLEKPDPDVSLPAEEREIGGLGIFMVKKMMDEVSYQYEDEKNVLTLCKHLPEA